MYACAKCDDHQMVRLDEMFRKECQEKIGISYCTYHKARQALIEAGIFKPVKNKTQRIATIKEFTESTKQ